jgi:hypothetical protein
MLRRVIPQSISIPGSYMGGVLEEDDSMEFDDS